MNVLCHIWAWTCFLLGLFIGDVLRKRGYNSYIKVIYIALTFHFGPLMLLGLIWMRGESNEKQR